MHLVVGSASLTNGQVHLVPVEAQPLEHLAQAHVAALVERRNQLVRHKDTHAPGPVVPVLGAPRHQPKRCQVVERMGLARLGGVGVGAVVTAGSDGVELEWLAEVPHLEARTQHASPQLPIVRCADVAIRFEATDNVVHALSPHGRVVKDVVRLKWQTADRAHMHNIGETQLRVLAVVGPPVIRRVRHAVGVASQHVRPVLHENRDGRCDHIHVRMHQIVELRLEALWMLAIVDVPVCDYVGAHHVLDQVVPCRVEAEVFRVAHKFDGQLTVSSGRLHHGARYIMQLGVDARVERCKHELPWP